MISCIWYSCPEGSCYDDNHLENDGSFERCVLRVACLTQKGSSWCYYNVMIPLTSSVMTTGLPWWFSGKESPCQRRSLRRLRLDLWVRKVPWRRKWQPTLILLPGESHGQRSLWGCSPWGGKELSNWTDFIQTAELLSTHSPYDHCSYSDSTVTAIPADMVAVIIRLCSGSFTIICCMLTV